MQNKDWTEQCYPNENIREYNIGNSNYADYKIQPWDIWKEYNLNPWDADIVKRVLRTKKGNDRSMDYEKIIHICKERIQQLANNKEREGITKEVYSTIRQQLK